MKRPVIHDADLRRLYSGYCRDMFWLVLRGNAAMTLVASAAIWAGLPEGIAIAASVVMLGTSLHAARLLHEQFATDVELSDKRLRVLEALAAERQAFVGLLNVEGLIP